VHNEYQDSDKDVSKDTMSPTSDGVNTTHFTVNIDHLLGSKPKGEEIKYHDLAMSFPIPAEQLKTPKEFVGLSIDDVRECLGFEIPHLGIADHVYNQLVERPTSEKPDQSQRASLRKEAIEKAQRRAEEIRNTNASFPPVYTQEFASNLEAMAGQFRSEEHFICDPTLSGFSFLHIDKPENVDFWRNSNVLRLYITLNTEHRNDVGIHFIALINLLKNAGIPVTGKASEPYYIPRRYDNIVLLIPEEHKASAEKIIGEYLENEELVTSEHMPAALEHANGIAWGREPEGHDRKYTRGVMRRDPSFNTCSAAKIMPHYILRLLTMNLEAAARETLLKELERIQKIQEDSYGT